VAATDDGVCGHPPDRRVARRPKVPTPVLDRQLASFLPTASAGVRREAVVAAILDEEPTELHGKWAPIW